MVWGESTNGHDGKTGIARAYGVIFLRGSGQDLIATYELRCLLKRNSLHLVSNMRLGMLPSNAFSPSIISSTCSSG